MGYARKTIEHGGLRVDHVVYAAPGTDEALLERIVFTNVSERAKEIAYFDYWDVAWWLVRATSPIAPTSAYDPAHVATSYDAQRGALKATSLAEPRDLEVPSLTDDPSPKTAFVAWLGDAPDRFETVQGALFGAGDAALPEAVRRGALGNGLDASGTLANEDAVLATQKGFALAPGETRALHVLYGIAPRGAEDEVIDRFRAGPPDRLHEVAAHWAARTPRFALPEERWVARETAWSAYYLLSGMLREDWFETRVVNQGSIYQYFWGANAGPRAALRHLVPLVWIDPDAAREVLVYYLRAMRPSGQLSYATAGYGGWQPFGFEPSDSGLWLLWAAAEYVHATRDFAFLDEGYEFYCDERRGACGSAPAYEMLRRAWVYQAEVVGTGQHGLVRLLDSDWDDFLTSFSRDVDAARTEELGESTLNTALALVAYPRFATLAERRGDAAFAERVRGVSSELAAALDAQWRGDHLNRAYVYTSDGRPIEVGASNLWLAPNGVALLAEPRLAPDRAARLVARMRGDLFEPSPMGLASQGAPITPNLGTAGFWYSLAGPAIEGLARLGEVPGAHALAWDAFLRQTFAQHAETYPDVWYGVWSGPDMYFTPLDAVGARPGETWCFPGVLCMQDFPIGNMFSHSEPLVSGIRIAGLAADGDGLVVDPVVPYAEFSWESPFFAVARRAGEIAGRVTALGDDVLRVRVRAAGLAEGGVRVRVDGGDVPFSVEQGLVAFDLPVRARVAAAWSVAAR
jgi:cellobiose phosphorylase